jgi:hypothetical protein
MTCPSEWEVFIRFATGAGLSFVGFLVFSGPAIILHAYTGIIRSRNWTWLPSYIVPCMEVIACGLFFLDVAVFLGVVGVGVWHLVVVFRTIIECKQ